CAVVPRAPSSNCNASLTRFDPRPTVVRGHQSIVANRSFRTPPGATISSLQQHTHNAFWKASDELFGIKLCFIVFDCTDGICRPFVELPKDLAYTGARVKVFRRVKEWLAFRRNPSDDSDERVVRALRRIQHLASTPVVR